MTLTLPAEGAAAALQERAWALKARAQSAWASDPSRTREAADALAVLLPAADPPGELQALTFWTRGLAMLAEGELPGALARLQAAEKQWRVLAQPLHAAQVQVAQLVPLSLMGRFDEAAACGAAAAVVLLQHRDELAAAKLAINLGSLEMQRDRYAEAAHHYKHAAVLAARAGATQHSIMADIGMADALSYAGRDDEAKLAYDRASMRADVHGLAVQSAQAEGGRALLALDAGQVREGLAGLVRARQAFERCGIEHDRLEVEKNLADAYLSLRLLPEALALYETLLARLRAQAGESTLPWLLLQLAAAQSLAGRTDLARTHLDEARAHLRQQSNTLGLAWTRLAQAELHLAESDDPLAEAAARDVDGAAGLPPALVRRANLILAACARRRGEPGMALKRLDVLHAELSAQPQLQLQARCWYERGLTLAVQGDAAGAAQAHEQAIASFEELRLALPGDELQHAVLGDHLGPYVERLAHALAHEPADAVLHWLDRYRARVLSERLEHGAVPSAPAEGADEDVAGSRRRLRWLQHHRQRRLQDGDGEPALALQVETAKLERDLVERARRQRVMQPYAGALTHSLVDAHRLLRNLGPDRALIEYGASGDEVFAVVVSGGRVQVLRRLATWPAVLDELRQLRFQLDTLRGDMEVLQPHLPQLTERTRRRLQQLHAWLLAPLESALAGTSEWVVVPHGVLHALPFAALCDERGWLNGRVRLRMAASAAVAALPMRPPLQAGGTALVVADTRSLIHVGREADTVAASLQRPVCLLGAQALVDATVNAARRADIVHLACHGEFRADNPQFSALHLADGAWTAMQIAESPVPARLVVMSACDTGLADRMLGDESVGLVRAFLLAGAHEVVASLWAVDDEATADFMRFFYQAWSRRSGDAAMALCEARFRASLLRPHPHFWAAFVLHGAPADRGV